MKTLFLKVTRWVVLVSVPMFIMIGCESDFIEPENATPPKSKLKMPKSIRES